MATLDDLFCAAVVKGDLGEQASDVQTQLFTLAELAIEEDIAKFANGARCQLGVALVHIGQVAQSSSYLNQDHCFAVGGAVEFE